MAVVKREEGKRRLGVHFDERDVGFGVRANQHALPLRAVRKGHRDLCRVACHVVVRDNVSVGRYHKTRADALHLLLVHAVGAAPKKALEERIAGKRIAVVHLLHLNHVDGNDGRSHGFYGPCDGCPAADVQPGFHIIQRVRLYALRRRYRGLILRLRGLFASGEEKGEEKGYFLHGFEKGVSVESVRLRSSPPRRGRP